MKSKAKIIVTLNGNKDRNVLQIQISPGSKRHEDEEVFFRYEWCEDEESKS